MTWYSLIYKDEIRTLKSIKTIYAVKHCNGENGVNKFFNWLDNRKEAELISSVRNSRGHFDELEEITIEASKGEINEDQLRTLIDFIRRKIEPWEKA